MKIIDATFTEVRARPKHVGLAILLGLTIGAMTSCAAHAAFGTNPGEKYVPMPIDFVGEWCSDPLGNTEGGADFIAPSRLDDNKPCTGILSVDKYGFAFMAAGGAHCYPVTIRFKEDRAPSGTAYIATIKARCHPYGPIKKGTIENYKFSAYKGRLSVQNLAD